MKEDLVVAISTIREGELLELARSMLDKGEDPQVILDACSEAMSIMGREYEDGNYFLAELMMSGEILRQISEMVEPMMAGISTAPRSVAGKVVIGTVKNDIHDIGKNIVAFMLEVNGFEVHDLGVDVPVEAFVDSVREIEPDIVALSGFLTVVFDQMKETVEALETANLRDRVRVMIGGCQMDENIVKYVGTDAFRPNAVAGVKLASEWVGGVRVMEKSNRELYQERLQRVTDVIDLKVPDLVPIVSPVQAFTYWYAGVTLKEAMYDYEVARTASRKFCLDFQPDLDFGPVLMYPAKVMDLMGLQWFRWPGHGISDDTMYQFIEGEYMKGDEYDEFIFDPGHYMTTKWMPRSFSNLSGLEHFPAMRGSMWYGWLGSVPPFAGNPELWRSLETLRAAGEEITRWFESLDQYKQEIREEGFPIAYGGWAFAPFDLVGDTLRGVQGILPKTDRSLREGRRLHYGHVGPAR